MSLNTLPFNPFPPSSDQKGSGGGGSYVLPAATDETLGGIKVGDNLTVEEDGTLNALDPYSPPDYSTTEQATGQKWIDGKDIYFRTFDLGSDVTISAANWVNMSTYIPITGWDKPMDGAFGIDSTGICLNLDVAINAGYLEIKVAVNSQIRYVTVYYTKAETEE